jgi:hypothetical protein
MDRWNQFYVRALIVGFAEAIIEVHGKDGFDKVVGNLSNKIGEYPGEILSDINTMGMELVESGSLHGEWLQDRVEAERDRQEAIAEAAAKVMNVEGEANTLRTINPK